MVAEGVRGVRVCRGMQEDSDALPKSGSTARTLGVSPSGQFGDIIVTVGDYVFPGTGGMSVSPWPPENIEEHRRPEEFGGTGKDPVWEMDTEDLPRELRYQPDPEKPDVHGYIAPARWMSLSEYQRVLHGTRTLWVRV
jgi:hypothetical protein